MTAAQPAGRFVERRKRQPQAAMSEDYFRELTMKRLDEGNAQFASINGTLETMAGHIATISEALTINTELTRKTAELAVKTAHDTAGLVRLANFGEATVDVVAAGTTKASRLAKLLIPILVIGGICGALWRGETLTWKAIIEAVAK